MKRQPRAQALTFGEDHGDDRGHEERNGGDDGDQRNPPVGRAIDSSGAVTQGSRLYHVPSGTAALIDIGKGAAPRVTLLRARRRAEGPLPALAA